MTKPKKGTPEWDLWITAIDIAVYAPWKQAESAFAAQIPWTDIHKLRNALEACGIDWKKVKAS